MGCTSSKSVVGADEVDIDDQDTKTVFPLKISSFYIDMSNTFAKDKNINKLICYFFDESAGKGIDIMAVQGINSMIIYKEIIKTFKKIATEKDVHLYFYPYNPNDFENTDSYATWSLSDKSTDDISTYNKLFISRYEPLIYIEDSEYKSKKQGEDNEKLTSFRFVNSVRADLYDKLHIINVCVNDIIVSVYNVNIMDDIEDNSGSYNNRLRKIKRFLEINTKEIDNYSQLNDSSIDNRCIHIICGNFNINEIKDNSVNGSYVKLIKKLNSVDMFRYVMGVRDKNDLKYKYDTNIFFSRNNYILLFMNTITKLDDFKRLGSVIHREHGMFITDSYICSNMSDLFMNYPTEIEITLDNSWVNKREKRIDESVSSTYKNIEFTADQFRDMILSNVDNDDDTSSYDDEDEDSDIEELGIEITNMMESKDNGSFDEDEEVENEVESKVENEESKADIVISDDST